MNEGEEIETQEHVTSEAEICGPETEEWLQKSSRGREEKWALISCKVFG